MLTRPKTRGPQSTARSSSPCATATPRGRGRRRDDRGQLAEYPSDSLASPDADPRRPDCLDLLRHAIEDLGLKGVKFGPIYNGVHLSITRLEPVYRYCVDNDLPLTMHMGTTYARKARSSSAERSMWSRSRSAIPISSIDHGAYGTPLVRGMHRRHAKQPNVYLRGIGALLPAVAVLEHTDRGPGIQDRRQDLLRHRYPFTTVEESIEGLRTINRLVDGTGLPRVADETIEGIIHSDPFEHWWQRNPL